MVTCSLQYFSVFGMSQLLDILHKHRTLSDEVVQDVRNFIRSNNTFKPEGDNATASKPSTKVRCAR